MTTNLIYLLSEKLQRLTLLHSCNISDANFALIIKLSNNFSVSQSKIHKIPSNSIVFSHQ